jgi:CO/xanthine dehydrogenase FAD-binding subunit
MRLDRCCRMPALYHRPHALDAALGLLAERRLRVLAGATDIYPALVGRSPDLDVLDITGLGELDGITRTAEGWRIGALTRWSAIAQAPLPPLFAGLQAAAGAIGGRQIQNAATLGGNLCNASPAADGVPCLLAIDARVELASTAGRRCLPLDAFILGNRRTALRDDEILTAIFLPEPTQPSHSVFLKLGARRHLVISIVMVAVTLGVAQGRVAQAAAAVGACAPTARRLPALEARLLGEPVTPALARLVQPECLTPLAPIDDMRGTASYRLDAAATLLRRALTELAAGG